MPTFHPNGFITHDSCPVCQEPGIKIEHGHNEHGTKGPPTQPINIKSSV